VTGGRGVGDVDLAAVDHPLVAVPHRPRLDPGHVGAGVRLGDGDGADHLALDRGHQVALAQLVAPEVVQRGRRHVGVDADAHGDAGVVAAGDLLEKHGREGPVQPRAAPLGVVAEPEQPQVPHLPVQALVDPAGLVELARAGPELFFDELPDRVAEDLVLGCVEQVDGHRHLLSSRDATSVARRPVSQVDLCGERVPEAGPRVI
jgi:hypothetical protein